MTKDLGKIWAIFTPSERRKSVWMLVLVILMAMAETAGVISIVPFLSVLSRPDIIQHNPLLHSAWTQFGFHDRRNFIIALGVASMALVIGSAAFKTVTLHILNRFVHLLRHAISARLLGRYLHQPYEFFLVNNPSILSRNVLSEVDQLLFQLIQPLSQLIAQGCVVLAMAALIFWYDPLTAVGIVVVLTLLYGTVYSLAHKRLDKIGRERQQANGARYKACNEALNGIKDVKITQSAPAYRRQFEWASRLLSRHMATNATLGQAPLYLVEATGYGLLIVLALILLVRSQDIARVLPALGLYGFAAYRMLPAAQIMYRGIASLKFSTASLDTVYTDLKLPEEAPRPAVDPIVPQHEIRLTGIRFAYPSAPDKPVFEDFNLTIPAHTSLGIAGKSGAGKSTLMDLLLALLHPQAGALTVDGVPITADNAAAWQRAIGYVPQHIYLADTSVTENIAFGVDKDNIDMQAVERAARAAQIHDFITTELPQGYDTPIGDRGIRLSGGQQQRIGIARALYHDPAVLLMDEATSALDSETEDAVNQAIQSLADDKTIIVIAHRKTSLRNCQHLITMGGAHSRSDDLSG